MKSTKLSYLFEFPKFKKEIKNLNDIIFFFPFYHFGGGETVHLDILKIFKEYSTSCFIVHKSDNDFLKNEFENVTQLIDLGTYKSLKYETYFEVLAKAINAKENAIIFGCNNIFFYKLLPYIDEKKVKIVDLTHAFSYEDPNSVEKFSLPVAYKIHKRIVLGPKTYNDFKQLYENNNIDANLLKRIVIINNKVDIPAAYLGKQQNAVLQVLFVSRNSFEKRPEILFEIARRCYERNINAFFTVVGDFENVSTDLPNVKIVGSVREREKMNELYEKNDLLLITSFREGFPMVILEGMAFGTVPVSTNVGEISSFINQKNNNGILLDDLSLKRYISQPHKFQKKEKWLPENILQTVPQDLEDIIENFISTITNLDYDRERLKNLSLNAYSTLKENYSEEKQRNAYLKLFKNLEN